MAGILLQIPIGNGNARIPHQRLRELESWLRSHWPLVTCERMEFDERPRAPWSAMFFSFPDCNPEEFDHYLTMDERVFVSFLGNQVQFRYTYFGGAINSIEAAVEFADPLSDDTYAVLTNEGVRGCWRCRNPRLPMHRREW